MQLSGRTSLVFADVFGVEFFELFFIRINFLQCARKFIGAHRCGRGNLPASVLFSFHTIIIPHNPGRYTQKCAFGRKSCFTLFGCFSQGEIGVLFRHRPLCHFYSPPFRPCSFRHFDYIPFLSFRLKRACGARNEEISNPDAFPVISAYPFTCHFDRAQRVEKS